MVLGRRVTLAEAEGAPVLGPDVGHTVGGPADHRLVAGGVGRLLASHGGASVARGDAQTWWSGCGGLGVCGRFYPGGGADDLNDADVAPREHLPSNGAAASLTRCRPRPAG